VPHYLVDGYIFGASVLHQVGGVESAGWEQPAPWKWHPMSPASVTPLGACLGLFVLERGNLFSRETLHLGSRLPNPKPHHFHKRKTNHQLMAMALGRTGRDEPMARVSQSWTWCSSIEPPTVPSTHARAELQKDRIFQDGNPQTKMPPPPTSLYCSHGAPSPDMVRTWDGPNRLPSQPGRDQLD
jgi:hypothetical protein